MTQAANPDFRHRTPPELRAVLDNDHDLEALWKDLTPLARNERICWMTSAKKAATREARSGS